MEVSFELITSIIVDASAYKTIRQTYVYFLLVITNILTNTNTYCVIKLLDLPIKCFLTMFDYIKTMYGFINQTKVGVSKVHQNFIWQQITFHIKSLEYL